MVILPTNAQLFPLQLTVISSLTIAYGAFQLFLELQSALTMQTEIIYLAFLFSSLSSYDICILDKHLFFLFFSHHH